MPGPFTIKTIAIIGAGPSGIAAAKHLLATAAFDRITILEQQDEVGGVWCYNERPPPSIPIPQTDPDVLIPPLHGDDNDYAQPHGPPVFANPMYDDLHTNLPKTLMSFPDHAFPSETRLFPTRQDVQAYLIDYARELRPYICFSTQVQRLDSLKEEQRRRGPRPGPDPRPGSGWEVTVEDLIAQETSHHYFDAVVVATGHYSVPFVPDVRDMSAFHQAWPGVITHSMAYRNAKAFVGKKVIVVGNSASGLDISQQISAVSQKPLLNSVRTPHGITDEHGAILEVPMIERFLPDRRGVQFSDGRVEQDVDAVVYSTGYFFSYPFLKHLMPGLVDSGQRVLGTYEQLLRIDHPTLAFPALPYKIVPFPLADAQAAVVARVWTNALSLPAPREMRAWEERRARETGGGRNFHVLGFPQDALYINRLCAWCDEAEGFLGKKATPWGPEQFWLRKHCAAMRAVFGKTGFRAHTVEELGYHFDPVTIEKI